jgi:hypothetical protein
MKCCKTIECLNNYRNAYRLLVGKPEGKRHKEHQNIGGLMNLVEVGWGDVDWIGLAQDRIGSCECGYEPSGSMKCWETIEYPNN